jgi:hypothetical protein
MAVECVLEMDFATELNRLHRIRVNEARADLTQAQIGTAMDDIISRNIFQGPGGDLTAKLGARLVTRESQDFNLV